MRVEKLMGANVYINDVSKQGQASEITCPDITGIMNEHSVLCLAGTLEFWQGFSAMEATIKWTYPDNEAKRACANMLKPVDIMVRSSKAVYDNGDYTEDQPVVIYMRGTPKTHPGHSLKPKEDTDLETSFAISYYKEEVNGEEIIEVDVFNNIYKVGGEDLLEQRNRNLGLI